MTEKVLKDQIVIFRIPKEQAATMAKMLAASPVIGISSVNQFFRKLGQDFLAGRMAYKNAEDSKYDVEMSLNALRERR